MFCVYLTTYYGNLLPKKYVGSSSVERILNGYRGSVKSKKWKNLWNKELEENPHLFKTIILSYHETNLLAKEAELKFQKENNVVKSIEWINESYATINGCFGRDVSGLNHPFHGKTHSEETKEKISNTLKQKFLDGKITSPFATYNTKGENNPFYGKTHSEETKEKMRKPKKFVPKYVCPHCGKHYDRGNLFQHMKRNGFTLEQIDLIKPADWQPPSHYGNHGLMKKL